MLRALDKVVVCVRDLDAASATYTSLLGRRPSWRGELTGRGMRHTVFRLANTSLELLSPGGAGELPEWLGAWLDGAGEGVCAIAFAADDAKEAAAELLGRGIDAGEPDAREAHSPDTGSVRRWLRVLVPGAASRGARVLLIEHRSGEALPVAAVDAETDAGSAVLGLDHVVVQTAAPDAARGFYGETLSLRLALDREFERLGARMMFFRIGGLTVEVMARLGGEPEPDASDRFGGLAWSVPDAGAARARLAAADFDVSELRPGRKPGTRVCTVRAGTCGVPTLIIEPGDAR